MAEPLMSGEALKSERRSNESMKDQVRPYLNINNIGFDSKDNDMNHLTMSSTDIKTVDSKVFDVLDLEKDDVNKENTVRKSDNQCHLSTENLLERSNVESLGISSSQILNCDVTHGSKNSNIGTQPPIKRPLGKAKLQKL